VTEDERAELERLRAENVQLKSKKTAGELTFKISEKGGLSVYGLGRFPVTLYKEQWRKLPIVGSQRGRYPLEPVREPEG
jgi:hypothetical protein